MTPARPAWLRWAERLQAIAQTGLTYAKDAYDRERYEELRRIAVEIAAAGLDAPAEEVSGRLRVGARLPDAEDRRAGGGVPRRRAAAGARAA